MGKTILKISNISNKYFNFISVRLSFGFFLFYICFRPITDLFTNIEIFRNITPNDLLGGLFLLICGIQVIKKIILIKSNQILRNFNIIYLFFLAICLFSFINTDSIFISIKDLLRLLTILITFNFVFIFFNNSEKKLYLINAIIFSSLTPLFFGMNQYILNTGYYDYGFNRIRGVFVHSNAFAQYLLIIFFLIMLIISYLNINKLKRVFMIILSMIILFEIYNTFARVTWIALVIGIILFILIRMKLLKKIIYSSIFIIAFFIFLPFVYERFKDIFNKEAYASWYLNSLDWRLELWRGIFENLKIDNLITGYGLGMFKEHMGIEAHNDYLRILYEIGSIGLLFYLFFLLYISFIIIRNIYYYKSLKEANKYKIGLILMVTLMITSLTDNLIVAIGILVYFYSILAIILNPDISWGEPIT